MPTVYLQQCFYAAYAIRLDETAAMPIELNGGATLMISDTKLTSMTIENLALPQKLYRF